MAKTDISYVSNGITLTLFANTQEGEKALNEIANHFPDFTMPEYMLPSLTFQLKAVGLTIRKQRLNKVTSKQIDALYDILKEQDA